MINFLWLNCSITTKSEYLSWSTDQLLRMTVVSVILAEIQNLLDEFCKAGVAEYACRNYFSDLLTWLRRLRVSSSSSSSAPDFYCCRNLEWQFSGNFRPFTYSLSLSRKPSCSSNRRFDALPSLFFLKPCNSDRRTEGRGLDQLSPLILMKLITAFSTRWHGSLLIAHDF